VEQILKAVRAAITIPLTIKIRSGWDENDIVAVRVGRMAEENASTPLRCTRGPASKATQDIPTGHIAELKAAVRVPVVGNGDIVTPEDAVRMVGETGCDAVMVGRAALSNPWISPADRAVRRDRQLSHTRPAGPPPDDSHLLLHAVEHGAPDMVGRMKQFATYFTHGVRDGAKLRARIHHSTDASEITAQVEEFFLAGREAA
jgi:tRNA-dihydrouridine synthase